MPLPSGTSLSFHYVTDVTDAEFAEASAALDRALLRVIGLPEEVEIREFENTTYAMTLKVKSIIDDFTVSKLIAILPELVFDAMALWEKVQPMVSDEMGRKEFATKLIRYVYRKHDPDLPMIPEPFETMVEDMIINAVPDMIDGLESKLKVLFDKLREIFS